MLPVGETSGLTKRSKIQPFLDHLLPFYRAYLTPSRELSIDKSMIAFRGHIAFLQYIKRKPQPWGIKAYMLSESRMGYIYNLLIYYGKENSSYQCTWKEPHNKSKHDLNGASCQQGLWSVHRDFTLFLTVNAAHGFKILHNFISADLKLVSNHWNLSPLHHCCCYCSPHHSLHHWHYSISDSSPILICIHCFALSLMYTACGILLT